MFRICMMALALMTLPAQAQTENELATLRELVDELKKVVPVGWQVTLNPPVQEDENQAKSRGSIEIWRTEKVVCRGTSHPNPGPMSYEEIHQEEAQNKIPIRFSYNFWVMDYLSPERYAQLKADNAAALERVREMDDSLYEIWVGQTMDPFDSDSYEPRNEEEKRQVQELADAYKACQAAYIDQDCYYREVSFDFRDQRNWRAVESDEVHAECDAVLAKLKTVFTFYEKDGKPEIPEGLLAELQMAVPQGWKVAINGMHAKDWQHGYHRDDFNVEVWREEKVVYSELIRRKPNEPEDSTDDPAAGLGGIFESAPSIEDPTKGMSEEELQNYQDELDGLHHPYFNFELTQYMAPEKHAEFVARNRAIEMRTQELRDALAHIEQRPDDFSGPRVYYPYLPKTEEDEMLVRKFRHYAATNWGHHFLPDCHYKSASFRFLDSRRHHVPDAEEVNAECDAVLAKLMTVFTFYRVE